MNTPSSKYRFSAEVLDQIEWLKEYFELGNHADTVRFAISRLYREAKRTEKKNLKKSEK